MILAGASLALLLERCAPSVSTDTMAAVVAVESAGDPLAIGDNTLRRPFHPRDRASAKRLAMDLLARGHNLDIGLAQVNSANLTAYGVTAAAMFDPCRNVRVGSSIIAADYRWSSAHFPSLRLALWHAIAAYNSGSIYAGDGYARLVVSQASAGVPVVPSIALLTGGRSTQPAPMRRPAAQPTPRPQPTLLPGLAFSQPAPR